MTLSPISIMQGGRIIVAVLVVVTEAAAVMAGAGDSAKGLVRSEFIYQDAPYPACHASTIAETGDGLVAAWFGGTHERHSDVGIWVSRQEEGSAEWSEPVEVANGVTDSATRFPTWNPVLFQPKGGPLLLFYKVGPTPQNWWGMLKRSTDQGRTWGEAKRLPDGILGPIKNKPVQLSDDEIVLPSSSENDGWRVHFEFTNADATEWRRTPPINDPSRVRAIQPSILVHPRGKLQAVGRTRASGIFTAWSPDGGQSWEEMKLLELPNPSSGTDAVTLSDGRHLLVYNHNSNYKGRSPLNVAVSDDGVHWSAAFVLEDDPDAPNGFSYPAVIQTTDGLVHITYTWRRERIKHLVLDPNRFELRPITDGQWPGDRP